MSELSILNVGAGDNSITIGDDPQDKIRAARIIKDMLRRGYALLVEVERDGEKKFERAVDFDEKHCRYIIADLDSEVSHGQAETNEETSKSAGSEGGRTPQPKRRGRRRSLDASSVTAVAVGRSAGG